jgi:hypothetical protein
MKELEQVFNVQYFQHSVLLKFEWMFQTISPNRLSPEHADAPHPRHVCSYSHNGKTIIRSVWHLPRPFFWLGRGNDLQTRVGHQLFRLTIAFVLGPSDTNG